MDEKEIMERLLLENSEFKRIFDEHRLKDEHLAALQNKSVLTEQEKLAESELKKRKLVLKDKMYQMMSAYRKSR